jgi:hybrid cluster-associated redox disulfide protein
MPSQLAQFSEFTLSSPFRRQKYGSGCLHFCKDTRVVIPYSQDMEICTANDSLLPCLSVSELLKRHPYTVAVFMRRRMACVGCAIADFHTIAQAAALYNADLAQFTSELEHVIYTHPQVNSTAPMENTK